MLMSCDLGRRRQLAREDCKRRRIDLPSGAYFIENGFYRVSLYTTPISILTRKCGAKALE